MRKRKYRQLQWRICDTDEFPVQANVLTEHFICRGYQKKVVQGTHDRAFLSSRAESLQTAQEKKKEKTGLRNQVYFVTKCGPIPNQVKQIVFSNWKWIQSAPILRGINFRRALPLKGELVQSHLSSKKKTTWLHQSLKGLHIYVAPATTAVVIYKSHEPIVIHNTDSIGYRAAVVASTMVELTGAWRIWTTPWRNIFR